VTWHCTIGDLHGDNHTMVSADMPGVLCACGRVARATLGLSDAFCDRCCKTKLRVGPVTGEFYAVPLVRE
jgi:hypothetical protein